MTRAEYDAALARVREVWESRRVHEPALIQKLTLAALGVDEPPTDRLREWLDAEEAALPDGLDGAYEAGVRWAFDAFRAEFVIKDNPQAALDYLVDMHMGPDDPKEDEWYQRVRPNSRVETVDVSAAAALSVACPVCKEPPGRQCLTLNGPPKRLPGGHHERFAAAARGVP